LCPARTPEERALVARIAAAEKWANTADRFAATAPARAGRRAKWAAEITAQLGELPPDELERRIDDKQRAAMLRMTLASKVARRKAKENTAVAEAAERALSEISAGGA
jgi:uncharacterized protein YfaS (alpha-2-macroglobulin family)